MINLTCVLQDLPEPPLYVRWYHSNKLFSNRVSKGCGRAERGRGARGVREVRCGRDEKRKGVKKKKIKDKNKNLMEGAKYCSAHKREWDSSSSEVSFGVWLRGGGGSKRGEGSRK